MGEDDHVIFLNPLEYTVDYSDLDESSQDDQLISQEHQINLSERSALTEVRPEIVRNNIQMGMRDER